MVKRPAHHHQGFTLFEVSISLVILTVGVVSVLMLFPMGIKAQQVARAQALAGAMALTMIDRFAQNQHSNFMRQADAPHLALSVNTLPNTNLDQAITQYTTTGDYGLIPLPDDIAKRLDSEGDEIAELLAQGGHLFYVSPRPPNLSRWRGGEIASASDEATPPEQQRILVGIVGYPQQDALRSHPCRDWPFWEYFPSPPVLIVKGLGNYRDANDRSISSKLELNLWLDNPSWPGQAEILVVHDKAFAASAYMPPPANADPQPFDEYIAACQALVSACGVTTRTTAGGPVPVLPQTLTGTFAAGNEDAFPKPYKIAAMRFLANAALLRTTAKINPATQPLTNDQRQYAKDCVQASMEWAHRYAAADPYDWGAVRPTQLMHLMDCPLLQSDLFGPVVSRTNPAGKSDRAWLVMAPTPTRAPQNFGRAYGIYNHPSAVLMDDLQVGGDGPINLDNPANLAQLRARGNHAYVAEQTFSRSGHFNLLNAFAPSQRCRQMVFWIADWQSYEDFEEAPSVPFDAKLNHCDSDNVYVVNGAYFRNPERHWVFHDANRAGDSNLGYVLDAPSRNVSALKAIGAYGADRNGNLRFDRGPLPKSARLRAELVARYNYYDPCILAGTRF